MDTVVRLAEQTHGEEGGFPAWGWGISAFVILMTLLFVTLSFGKGRPHA
ncbi:hypothetical protein CLV30_102189 [Haloactinopolyspora alba]|uniref:Uncharacterized protein n=1 Tax=Haloactinopolyspora alba TaxID=648780 RepID=A0A2P8EBF2_9ACTN|nr:hypothetical protein [Haloactinopolyspora alba]PSL06801.1 hypothetical protein CLV30_102189 [Haloactinopolyspora alba]